MNDENLDTDDSAESDDAEMNAASDGSEGGADEEGAGKKTLGLERWVQLGYMVAALLLMWLSGHMISTIWYFFADPSEPVVTALSVVVGVGTSIALYRNASFRALSEEVADELSKVSWPTRQETSNSTVVVIVASIIAAVFLGFFDAIWSALTDIVYKV